MVNFSSLGNLTSFSFNESMTNVTENIIPSLVNNSNTITQNYYGLGVMIVMFIVLVFIIFRDDGDIRLDITRSIMKSAGFVSIIGIIGVVSGIFTSFVHVSWFIVIFTLFYVLTYLLKKKGL